MKPNKKNKAPGIIFIIILVCLALITVAVVLFKISKSRDFQFFGELITEVQTSEKRIALTFDDGPTEVTQSILNLLDELDIKATFFLCGKEIEARPQDAAAIAERGHAIGNHSYSHKRMILVPYDFCRNEIEKTNELIRSTGYTGEIYFRPPYFKRLFMLPLYLQNNNIKTILCSVEPETVLGNNASPDEIADYVIHNTENGSIILMHPMYNPETVLPAIRKAVTELKKEGYTFCTVEELIN
ncbi:MAG: polysaccharide deacetylase family protein [Eubacteriales bacterium]